MKPHCLKAFQRWLNSSLKYWIIWKKKLFWNTFIYDKLYWVIHSPYNNYLSVKLNIIKT